MSAAENELKPQVEGGDMGGGGSLAGAGPRQASANS